MWSKFGGGQVNQTDIAVYLFIKGNLETKHKTASLWLSIFWEWLLSSSQVYPFGDGHKFPHHTPVQPNMN